MMARVALLLLVASVAVVLFYLSRFWFLDLWPRGGLFGIEELRPGGGLLGRWLRGTPFAPFELVIWAAGVFLVLTGLQRLVDVASPSKKDDPNDT